MFFFVFFFTGYVIYCIVCSFSSKHPWIAYLSITKKCFFLCLPQFPHKNWLKWKMGVNFMLFEVLHNVMTSVDL